MRKIQICERCEFFKKMEFDDDVTKLYCFHGRTRISLIDDPHDEDEFANLNLPDSCIFILEQMVLGQ